MDLKMSIKISLAAVLYFAFTISATKAQGHLNLPCESRPAVIPTVPARPVYFPYFVSLHRCNGSYGTHSPAQYRCVPKTEETITLTVSKAFDSRTVTLKNHTSCKVECALNRENCPAPNDFHPNSCTCKCHHKAPPAGVKCPANKWWSPRKCACVCKLSKKCENPKKYAFDAKTCSCQCKPSRKERCLTIGGTFRQDKCKCITNSKRMSGFDNDAPQPFVGSTNFWIYMLIGEFVLLMICFDVALSCKQMGFTYKVIKSCKKVEKSAEISENEECNFPQEVKVHFNEGCQSAFSSLSNIPTSSQLNERQLQNGGTAIL
eukprot:Seg386.3 transcript_id=Seg386.3/GoldUCD/mRNA.D3Y31 product="hypothetical protein" protein_id=Seg386.3/GoldUCD/D3Y31